MMLGIGWRGKELSGKKNTIMSKGPPGPVLTPLLTPWDGASTNGPGKRHVRESHMGWGLMECQPHGPSTASRENGLLMGPG